MFLENQPEIVRILFLILALGLGWVILRFVLKVAKRIFMAGCFMIILLGGLLFFFQILRAF